jgi:hypothetical protein
MDVDEYINAWIGDEKLPYLGREVSIREDVLKFHLQYLRLKFGDLDAPEDPYASEVSHQSEIPVTYGEQAEEQARLLGYPID